MRLFAGLGISKASSLKRPKLAEQIFSLSKFTTKRKQSTKSDTSVLSNEPITKLKEPSGSTGVTQADTLVEQ